jgi:uncharacterized membrane protein YtjA (UPF0391 family)
MKKGVVMFRAAAGLLAFAVLAAVIGFSGSAGYAAKVAQVVFAISFVVAGLALLADAHHVSQRE